MLKIVLGSAVVMLGLVLASYSLEDKKVSLFSMVVITWLFVAYTISFISFMGDDKGIPVVLSRLTDLELTDLGGEQYDVQHCPVIGVDENFYLIKKEGADQEYLAFKTKGWEIPTGRREVKEILRGVVME